MPPGLADRVVEVNREAAAISKRAAGERAVVFGSIGPSGKMLCMGEVTADELRDVFAQQAAALAEGGADGIVVETMADLEEARLAVEAAKSTGLPVVACMCFDSGADNDRTMMGTTPEQAAEELQSCGRGRDRCQLWPRHRRLHFDRTRFAASNRSADLDQGQRWNPQDG